MLNGSSSRVQREREGDVIIVFNLAAEAGVGKACKIG